MKKFYGFVATLATALVITDTSAQTASSNNGFALEEVIVTARKIEENLQDTPISVTALSGDALEDRGALNIIDAANIAPNVALGDSAGFSGSSSAPTVFIRGIGQADFLIVNDPAVGIYLDGIYVARSIGGLVDLVDLERAEILRGPQGTLFGRNTIGGAVNLISKKPDNTFNARISGTVGEDDHYEGRLAVNAPVSDQVFARFAALYRKRNGYVDAAQYDSLKLGEDDSLTVRGQLRFLPTNDLTIDVSADYTRERESPAPVIARNIGDNMRGNTVSGEGEIFNTNTGDPTCLTTAGQNTNPACYGPVHLAGNFVSNSVWTDEFGNRITPENELDLWGVSATVEWDSAAGVFKSITAYREFDSVFFNDLDFSPHTVFHNINNPFDHEQFSQELQHTNSWFNDRLTTVVGLYYFEEEGIETVRIARANSALDLDGNSRVIDNNSRSAYAQATFDITERLHLTGGIRYTNDTKIFTASIDFRNRADFGPTSGRQKIVEYSKLLTLGFDITDNHYAYFTFSDGFRDGGFPARFTGGLPDPLPSFDPEFVDSYEIGLKNTFFDKRLRANLSAFHTVYDDLQVTATAPLSGEINTTTDNLANVTLTGVELELDAVIAENFKIDLTLGWLDDEIKELEGGALLSAGFTTTTDSDLPYTPKWNWNLGAIYSIPLTETSLGGELLARIDWRFVDKQVFRIENNPDAFEDSYHVLNASLKYTPPDNKWELVAGVRNLTDAEYATTATFSNIPRSPSANINRPRTVYGTFRYYWGE